MPIVGGHTEQAAELWKHDLPPLYGRKTNFCLTMPGNKWKKNFQSSKVQDKLNKQGYKTGLIKDIAIIKQTQSGRVKNLLITSRKGIETKITGKKV